MECEALHGAVCGTPRWNMWHSAVEYGALHGEVCGTARWSMWQSTLECEAFQVRQSAVELLLVMDISMVPKVVPPVF